MSRSCIAQGDAMLPEWIDLYLAPAMLNLMDDGRLRGAFGNVEAAIASAVQSGGVPTRGMASAAFAFERIDGRMTHDTVVEVSVSYVAINRKTFERVQVDIGALKGYLEANSVLPWFEIAHAAEPDDAAEVDARPSRKKAQRQREVARKAIAQSFQDGVPAELSNKQLISTVEPLCRGVSIDTILRAAERRT
jgi:hypothetical protein